MAPAGPLELDRLIAEALNSKGSSLGYLDRAKEAQVLLDGAVKIARAGGHVAAEIRPLVNLGALADNATGALDANRASAKLARRVGIRMFAR